MSDFVLSAALELRDRMTGRIKSAAKGLESVRSMAGSASSSINRASGSMDKAGLAAGRLQHKMSMLKGNYDIRVNARDEATPKISKVRQELSSLTSKAYTAVVDVKQNAPATAGKAMSGLSEAASGMMMGAGMQMLGAAGIGFGAYNAIKGYMDFEAEMSNVAAISGASGKAFDDLTQKAQQMGATTMFTSKQAAEALRYMGMAGWDAGQMMGGIDGIMNLAAASGEDLGRVSDIVTDALTGFGLKAEDAGHFADVLAKASSKSNTNVSMMGETFKYVAPMAGALKYSIEDVAAATGLMANAGIKGEQAGTSLRAIMTRLVKPTKESGTYLDRLTENTGIAVNKMTKADGTMKSWRQTMTELRKAFKTLSDAEKAEFAGAIAGQEAMSGFLAMMNASDADYSKIFAEIDHADKAAKEMAEKRMDNLAGDMTYLASAWDGLTQKIMKDSGAASGLRSAAKELKGLVDTFTGKLDKGLDTAILGTAAKAVTDLKDKFLQLDGVGSILAGGALALGLGKIISLSRRAYDAVKRLASMRPGAGGVGTAVPSSMASSVSSMVVNASSVVVNGKSVAGGGVMPPGGKNPGGIILGPNGKPLPPSTTTTQPPVPAAAGRGAMFKTMGAGALIGAVFAAADVYSTKSDRDRIKAEEEYGVAVAQAAVKEANNHLWNVNQDANATNEERSAAFEAFKTAKLELKAMEEHQKASEKDSQEIMGKSIGGAAGTIIGTAIGSLGGPIGMAAGGIIGQVIGEKLAPGLMDATERLTTKDVDFIKAHSTDTADSYDKAVLSPEEEDPYGYDVLAAGDSYDAGIEESIAQFQRQREQVEMSKQSVADLMHGFRELDTVSSESSRGVAAASTEMVSSLQENVPPAVETLSSVTDELESIDMDAETAGLSIGQSMGQAAADTQSAWEPIPPFFMENIYAPISDNASVCGSSAAEGINSGIPLIRSAWDEITSWLAEKFAWIGSKASAIAAKASSLIGGSGDVEGNAIGTSYFKGGWTEINEHGGEIIDLPQGSRIYPHATTVEMLKNAFSGYEAEERAMPLPSVQEISTPMVAMDILRNDLAGHTAEMTALPEFPNVLPQPSATELTENSFIDNGTPEEMVLSSFPALPPFPDLPSFSDLPQFPAIEELLEAPDIQIVPAAVEFVEKNSTDKPMERSEPQVSDLGAMLAIMVEKLNLAAKETGGKKDGLIAPSISISGNEFVVREDADIDRIAHELLRLIRQSAGNYQYVGV